MAAGERIMTTGKVVLESFITQEKYEIAAVRCFAFAVDESYRFLRSHRENRQLYPSSERTQMVIWRLETEQTPQTCRLFSGTSFRRISIDCPLPF